MRTAALPSCSQNIGLRSSPDIMATIVDVTGASYPSSFDGHAAVLVRRDAVRPVRDQRRRDAALVDPVLVEAKRAVREVGPRRAVALVRVLRPGHALDVVAEVDRLAAPRRPARDHELVDQLVDR